MPCGLLPPNPSELLSSKAMDDLLVKIKQEYQIVLLDAPPVIAVTGCGCTKLKSRRYPARGQSR
jgi:Mrp family chromosome partitioning ATPase